MTRPFFTLAACALIAGATSSAARDDLSPGLEKLLAGQDEVPGLVALRLLDGKVVAAGAAGTRKADHDAPIELGDKFHLGSCTKAMTATLAAILVERGRIRWETTIGEILKDDWVRAEYRPVTLTQLLSHTGGCPGMPPQALWKELFVSRANPERQRMELAKGVLSSPPAYQPGLGYEYSNSGYALAGVMLERCAGKPWEELMEEELFQPLQMESAGFGAPANGKRKPDQPWGHREGTPIPPRPFGDNPAAIGPAGTVHCSIEDWAKFARFHLAAEPGRLLKEKESFAKLHAIHHRDSGYGLGWVRRGATLAHDGSNTMWYAFITLNLRSQSAELVCVNAGGPQAEALCHKVRKWMTSGR